ncbi:MAG TPA: hypothetical protein VHN15_03900 [Thermoanaerobaculia bacterium]|nr:hypothetical protein [Thermoanaerobaculia bacterium]
MFRTMRYLGIGMMLLLAVAAPAAANPEPAAAKAEKAAEAPAGLWEEILSWWSAVLTGGGPFIDPNGGGTSVSEDGDGSRLVAGDGGPFIDPNG